MSLAAAKPVGASQDGIPASSWAVAAAAVFLVLSAVCVWRVRTLERRLRRAHTAHEEVQASWARTDQLLDSLLDRLPDLVYFKDTEGRFLRVNPAHAREVGQGEPSSLIGKTDFDFFPEAWARETRDQEQGIIRTGQPRIGRLEHIVRPGREERFWSSSKGPIRDGSGHVVGIVGLTSDVTDRVRAERDVERLYHDLEASAGEVTAANRELEAFAYSVSHDLRAPLRAIDGFSRILLRESGEKLDDEGRRLLGIVRENAQHMGRLIDDLLAFSRMGRRELTRIRVDMDHLVRVAWEEATRGEARCPELAVTELEPVMGDPLMLRQAFVNLLSNAVKFSRRVPHPHVNVRCSREGREIIYSIQDNGVGFDMKYSQRLFGVFQRLHSAEDFEGTGVGLAIVQRVAERHGGRVWGEGKPDAGASFHLALPLQEGGR